MRDDVMIRLTDRLMADADFRAKARTDLDGTLQQAGFALHDDEMAAVREFHGNAAGMSDEQLTTALANPDPRRQLG